MGAAEVHGKVLAPDAVYPTPCEIYAPCAIGATLSGDTIPRLSCRIVAGSANNQLARPESAEQLHERGILYAPDYMANAGGALAFGLMAGGQTNDDRIGEQIDGLQHLLARIFEEAALREESPAHAARRHVDRVLARARDAAQSGCNPDASDSHSA